MTEQTQVTMVAQGDELTMHFPAATVEVRVESDTVEELARDVLMAVEMVDADNGVPLDDMAEIGTVREALMAGASAVMRAVEAVGTAIGWHQRTVVVREVGTLSL